MDDTHPHFGGGIVHGPGVGEGVGDMGHAHREEAKKERVCCLEHRDVGDGRCAGVHGAPEDAYAEPQEAKHEVGRAWLVQPVLGPRAKSVASDLCIECRQGDGLRRVSQRSLPCEP